MARTALGTASDKSTALSLTIANVSLDQDDTLIVGTAYDTGQGAPTVTWGNHDLDLVKGESGGGLACRLWEYHRGAGTKSKTITVAWSGTAPTAKVMFATKFSGGYKAVDLALSQFEADTTAPDSGTATLTTYADEVFIGAIASEGPGNDAAGTPSNGYTAGQRVGVNGAPPVSNVTIQELYKEVSVTETTAAAMTGQVSRDHCSVLGTLYQGHRARRAITPSDLESMRTIFDGKVPELQRKNHAFHWSAKNNRWELYDIDLSSGTLVATSPISDVIWIEE